LRSSNCQEDGEDEAAREETREALTLKVDMFFNRMILAPWLSVLLTNFVAGTVEVAGARHAGSGPKKEGL
jgi:hypothetical protein